MLERVCWKPCAVASVAFEVDLVAAEEGVERFSWLVKGEDANSMSSLGFSASLPSSPLVKGSVAKQVIKNTLFGTE